MDGHISGESQLPGFVIRKACPADIDAIFAIEISQFTHPRAKKLLEDELTHNLTRFYVAENSQNNEIAGFILFWIIQETVELHDIAVRESDKHKGLGSGLMDFMLAEATQCGAEEIYLEVRASNVVAAALYEKYNFFQVGERKNYYVQPVEDALIYKLDLLPSG